MILGEFLFQDDSVCCGLSSISDTDQIDSFWSLPKIERNIDTGSFRLNGPGLNDLTEKIRNPDFNSSLREVG